MRCFIKDGLQVITSFCEPYGITKLFKLSYAHA